MRVIVLPPVAIVFDHERRPVQVHPLYLSVDPEVDVPVRCIDRRPTHLRQTGIVRHNSKNLLGRAAAVQVPPLNDPRGVALRRRLRPVHLPATRIHAAAARILQVARHQQLAAAVEIGPPHEARARPVGPVNPALPVEIEPDRQPVEYRIRRHREQRVRIAAIQVHREQLPVVVLVEREVEARLGKTRCRHQDGHTGRRHQRTSNTTKPGGSRDGVHVSTSRMSSPCLARAPQPRSGPERGIRALMA